MFNLKWFRSIKFKMLASYCTVVLLLVLIGFGAVYRIKRVYMDSNDIYDKNLKSVDYLQTLIINVRHMDQHILFMIEGLGNKTNEEHIEEINSLNDANEEIMKDFEALISDKSEEQQYDMCKDNLLTLNEKFNSIIDIIEAGDIDIAENMYNQEILPLEIDTYKMLDDVAELATKIAKENNENNYRSYQHVRVGIIITIILSVILAVIITLRVSGIITEKLGIIQRWAKRISEYNVSEDITDLGVDEFGMTGRALNDSQFMIRDLIEKIIEESTQISDTGKEISSSIRKSKQHIEDMNMKMLEADKDTVELIGQIKDIMLVTSLPPELLEKMKALYEISNNNTVSLDLFREELNSMAVYMEQIAITSDHQNVMAQGHKDQVGKFKVKKDNDI